MCTGTASHPGRTRLKIAIWIAGFYDVRRRQSADDALPAVTFEEQILHEREGHSSPSRDRSGIYRLHTLRGLKVEMM